MPSRTNVWSSTKFEPPETAGRNVSITQQMSSCVVWMGNGDGRGAGRLLSSYGNKAVRGLEGKLFNGKDTLVFIVAALFL